MNRPPHWFTIQRKKSVDKISQKKIEKPLDKIKNLWYNKATMKEKENS